MPLRHLSDIHRFLKSHVTLLAGAGTALLAACASIPEDAIRYQSPGRWAQTADPTPTDYDLVFFHNDEDFFRNRKHASEGVNALPLELPAAGSGLSLLLSTSLGPQERKHTRLPPVFEDELPWPANKPLLSPGDRLQLRIENGDEFSGFYEVDVDGTINLPYMPPIQVAGVGPYEARLRITHALVNAGYFRRNLVAVTLLVQQWSTIQVSVSGAVFAPGLVSVNVRKPEDKALKSDQVSGDYPSERFVSAALRAAGGVRPDADVHRIVLIRQGRSYKLDLSGVPVGLPADRHALVAGDQLIVPSTGVFDEGLVRPSAITPPGIRVFLSNLTVPATDNSKSAVNNFSSGLPYGTRLLSGLISANCVGGTAATNSDRFGVLVTRNPLTGETEVIQRSIEDMLREPEREALNPHLMPNDGIACYDSGVTNLRDIGKAIADILSPFR